MLKLTPEGVLLSLKIIPNSSKNDIVLEDEFVKVKIKAQPIENKANKALIEFLSKTVKIPKSSINIVRGELNREKTVLFKTNDKDIIQKIMYAYKCVWPWASTYPGTPPL